MQIKFGGMLEIFIKFVCISFRSALLVEGTWYAHTGIYFIMFYIISKEFVYLRK